MIPKKFNIAGGKTIEVKLIDCFDEPVKFGDFDTVTNIITVAKRVKDEKGNKTLLKDEDIDRTFYHELIHVFQWFYDTDFSEAQAQVYSNFIYEYIHSCQK